MAQVQRANVFLTIDDDEVEKYMAKGFSVVDENGNIVRQSVPTSLNELQKAFSEHTAKIKQLEAHITFLKNQLAEAQKASAAPQGETTRKKATKA